METRAIDEEGAWMIRRDGKSSCKLKIPQEQASNYIIRYEDQGWRYRNVLNSCALKMSNGVLVNSKHSLQNHSFDLISKPVKHFTPGPRSLSASASASLFFFCFSSSLLFRDSLVRGTVNLHTKCLLTIWHSHQSCTRLDGLEVNLQEQGTQIYSLGSGASVYCIR